MQWAAFERNRIPAIITLATATGTTAVYFWYPFLPLFLIEIGAGSEADAAFWVAAAVVSQGVGRLIGGPLWGSLSDRLGRKKMFIRALISVAIITALLGMLQHPWQLMVLLFMHGMFSGFNPAAIALASVSVPESRVRTAVNMVSGAQYIGMAIGPAFGALLNVVIGFRWATVISGICMVIVTYLVHRMVPADSVGNTPEANAQQEGGSTGRIVAFRISLQLALAMFVYFIIFSLTNFRALSTSVALHKLDVAQAIASTGIAFSLVGVASCLGVLMVSAGAMRRLGLRALLAGASALTGLAYLGLAVSDTVPLFVIALTLGGLLNAAMFPPTNTLIALHSDKSRRGTAFGLASSAQALAFVCGPVTAAVLAATSFTVGFVVIGGAMILLAVMIGVLVREPVVRASTPP